MKKETKKEILSWIKYIVITVVLAFLIVTYVGQITKVDGHSMENTLQDGDRVICDKISYRFGKPQRYDIVVIYPDDNKDERWIKRIIGLPGETVRIDEDGNIYINGEILEESYGAEIIEDPGLAVNEIKLGEDEYWCMGDNRNHSTDSRVIGPVPRSRIVGKAVFRIFPFNKIGPLKKA